MTDQEAMDEFTRLHREILAKNAEIARLTAALSRAVKLVERMLAEHGDDHYHTCPADDGFGECNCFAGALHTEVRDELSSLSEPVK